MALTVSRYGEVSPTEIHSSGIAVSTPIYITLTSDQRKALLNRFRQIKQEQLAAANSPVNDPGDASRQCDGTDAQAAGLAPVEDLLGMSEERLRYALFSRNGIPERLVVKLQRITGLELVNRRDIEATVNGWLDYLFSASGASNVITSNSDRIAFIPGVPETCGCRRRLLHRTQGC